MSFYISIGPIFLSVNRFVRFVSNPEILERVYTIESEILQIEEAIALQGNNDSGQGPVSIFFIFRMSYVIDSQDVNPTIFISLAV